MATLAAITLFVLQDAGETQALLPVIEKCQDCQIVAGGVAKEQLDKIPSLKGRVMALSTSKSAPRDTLLPEDELTRITALKVSKVVVGVAFAFQGQIAEAFAKKDIPTYGYWDNINPTGTDPYFATAQKVAAQVHKLLVPREAFKSLYPHAQVVGQPAIERWKETLPNTPPSPSTFTFVGGYGKEYEAAFLLFLETAKAMRETQFIVSFHPKGEGKFETPLIADLPNVSSASTTEAIARSTGVICHQSTVGVQAAAAGKPVFYLLSPSQSYTNPLIENNLAPRCTSSLELQGALKNPTTPSNFFEVMQMPQNSVQLLCKALEL